MRIKKISYFIFTFLPLAVTGIALMFLPDEVPMHYGAEFTVDRWGSKFELLTVSITFTIFGLVFMLISKITDFKNEENKNNQKVLLTIGLVILIIENIINLAILYAAYNGVTDLKTLPIDFVSLLMILFGILFIITGNIMPKTKMNSVVGFRTAWTMKNETVWKKNQFFAGVTFIITGLLVVIGCIFFFKGFAALFYMLALLAVMAAADIAYSYYVMKRDRDS